MIAFEGRGRPNAIACAICLAIFHENFHSRGERAGESFDPRGARRVHEERGISPLGDIKEHSLRRIYATLKGLAA